MERCETRSRLTIRGRRAVRHIVACSVLAAAFATASASIVPAAGAALQDPVAAPSTPFTDLDDVNDETLRAISCLYATGITGGTTAATFSPSQPVTRLQMALAMTRLLYVFRVLAPAPIDPGFTDLEELDRRTRSAVVRVFNHGIMGGTSLGEFSPSQPVTRLQMALFLTRLLTVVGVEPVSGFAPGFDDTAALDAESRAAIAQMRVDEVIPGISAEEFAPAATVTRDHMALFLSRALAVASSRKRSKPPGGCEDLVRSHNEVARPATLQITVSPREPQLGQPVRIKAEVTDRAGNPIPRLSVRLIRDGRVASSYVYPGPDGTITFRQRSAPVSTAASSISLEVRVNDSILTSPTTTIEWSVISLIGVTPAIAVAVSDSRPAVGDNVDVVATVTDTEGAPLGAVPLEFVIDGESRSTVHSDPDGQATFSYGVPAGPSNQGGYDSIQVRVVSTEVASRPLGVFWQPLESRRLRISVSPDEPHENTVRTITAQLLDGSSPVADEAVDLLVDGAFVEQATTNGEGVAQFTRQAPVHGPFDLVRAVLAGDRSVASNEILFSWPMKTRGIDPGNHWELVWSDEFNGESLDPSEWLVVNNCPPVYLACETDRPENVYVTEGMLHLRSLRERYAGTNDWSDSGQQFGPLTIYTPGRNQLKDFTGGRVDTKTSFTFGRFEMLGRLPQGHGTFFAFWMRSLDSPYGRNVVAGEISIAEGANIGKGGVAGRYGIDAQLPGPGWGIHHVVHMGMPFTNPFTLTNLPVNPAESFHLYAVEWDTASIRFYIDDQRVFTVPSTDWFSHPPGQEQPVDNPYAPFDTPFIVSIINQVGNWALETWPDHQVPDATLFPTDFAVDYVRVYECRPPPGSDPPGPGQGCETP